MKETADELSELCHRDVLSLQSCTDCFEHWINDADNHFTKVCTLPHVLVYAKFSDFPHWPAKIMSVDGNMVNVEFFGDHKQADVLASNCFLYSTRYPGKIGKNDALQDAIEVILGKSYLFELKICVLDFLFFFVEISFYFNFFFQIRCTPLKRPLFPQCIEKSNFSLFKILISTRSSACTSQTSSKSSANITRLRSELGSTRRNWPSICTRWFRVQS